MSKILFKQLQIPITAYYVDEVPTCSAKAGAFDCQFLTFEKMGMLPICSLINERLTRGNDGLGYLVPNVDCPLHGAEGDEPDNSWMYLN